MTNLRKAAEMALKRLERSESELHKARAALRQALAQPVDAVNISQERVDETAKREHEPVAWMHNFIEGTVITHEPADIGRHPDRWTPLYTAPPKQEWDGPTDEEYENFCSLIQREEAKLKEKNGG